MKKRINQLTTGNLNFDIISQKKITFCNTSKILCCYYFNINNNIRIRLHIDGLIAIRITVHAIF